MSVNSWVCPKTLDYKIYYNGLLHTRKTKECAADLIIQLMDDEREALRVENLDGLYISELPLDIISAARYSTGV